METLGTASPPDRLSICPDIKRGRWRRPSGTAGRYARAEKQSENLRHGQNGRDRITRHEIFFLYIPARRRIIQNYFWIFPREITELLLQTQLLDKDCDGSATPKSEGGDLKKTSLSIVLLLIVLAGCSAALVPYTSDPSKKLDQAYALMDAGRPLPAENLIDDALAIYQKEANELGMAEAYHTYANLYMSDIYYTFPRVSERRVKTKAQAVDYFQKALVLYEKHNDYIGATKCLYGMGHVYEMVGNRTDACKSYSESLATYNKAVERDPSAKLPFRTKEMQYSEVVGKAKSSAGCDRIETK
jgi:tetratricopeptide (TPR) repeat protein